jgi:hypothetical protein
MLNVIVIYEPTTRQLSLSGTDRYGGASNDTESVMITITGIPTDDTPETKTVELNFDVYLEKEDGVRIQPSLQLEHGEGGWVAVIPQEILGAAADSRKLPFRVTITQGDETVMSNNTMVLDITRAIDATEEASADADIFYDDGHAWQFVHRIDVDYNPDTRVLTLLNPDPYAGATNDVFSVVISVSGIEGEYSLETVSARIDFAVYVEGDDNRVHHPFVPLIREGEEWSAYVPRAIFAAAAKTRKLPFQLVIRDGVRTINSRNTLTLEVTRAIDATKDVEEEYSPHIMYRGDSWAWHPDVVYSIGSVVTFSGHIFVSLTDDNVGNAPQPGVEDDYWKEAAGGSGAKKVVTMGNGVDKEFDVVHELGTLSPTYVIQRGGAYVHTTVYVVDENTLHVKFNTPPAEGEYTMTVQ